MLTLESMLLNEEQQHWHREQHEQHYQQRQVSHVNPPLYNNDSPQDFGGDVDDSTGLNEQRPDPEDTI